jgi:hypothetical protein
MDLDESRAEGATIDQWEPCPILIPGTTFNINDLSDFDDDQQTWSPQYAFIECKEHIVTIA